MDSSDFHTPVASFDRYGAVSQNRHYWCGNVHNQKSLTSLCGQAALGRIRDREFNAVLTEQPIDLGDVAA